MKHPPIPDINTGAYTPQLEECGEPIISLSQLSDKIEICSYYYQHGYEGALADCYLRVGAAELLVRAAELLPRGCKLVVFDGWRPFQLQQSIYSRYKQKLMQQGWSDGPELQQELSRFVAPPSNQPDKPTPHLTGGAVDLTIADEAGLIDMGTSFDDFSEKAATRYYEEIAVTDDQIRRIRENRRMLYQLMTEVGFTNYPNEWWHYDYGNVPWARQKKCKAKYQGVIEIFN